MHEGCKRTVAGQRCSVETTYQLRPLTSLVIFALRPSSTIHAFLSRVFSVVSFVTYAFSSSVFSSSRCVVSSGTYLLLPFLCLIVYSFLVSYFPTRHFLSSYVLLLLLLHILLLFRVRIYVLVFCASSSPSLSVRPILFSCSLRTCARCLPSLLHHISFLALVCSVAYVRTYVRAYCVGRLAS